MAIQYRMYRMMKKETPFSGRFLTVTIEQKEGRTLEQAHVRDGVCVIPFTEESKILVILQRELDGKLRAKLVSGYVEEGEDPLACAQRELKEELGLTAKEWEQLSPSHSEEYAVQKTQYYFIARRLHEEKGTLTRDERIEKHLNLTLDEMKEKVLRGQFGSTSTAFTLLKLLYPKRKTK